MRRLAITIPILCVSVVLLLTEAPTRGTAYAQTTQDQNASSYLSTFEQEMLDEINLARTHPSEYAAYLEEMKPRFKGNEYASPSGEFITTNEGWGVVEEAITFLRAAQPLPALELSRGMWSGASELVKDHGQTGSTGHKGSDNSYCEQRVARFGKVEGGVGENLCYGNDKARVQVMGLLIDDGVSNRGHRMRLMSPSFKVAGIACGSHPSMSQMCVITLAGGFSESQTSTAPAVNQKSTGAATSRRLE